MPPSDRRVRQFHVTPLIGRNEEIEELDALLGLVRGGLGGAVVLRGEAGIGKTALLNSLIDAAGDLSVIRLEGVESEMQLGYAALHRLVRPYLHRVEHLPEPQRDALQSAFGLTSSVPADRFMVGLATLSLLGDVATDEPLLVVIDDAQWLDQESVASLVFVARRLHADPVALVFAARDSLDTGAVFQGVPELRISGIGEDAARNLLSASVIDPVSYQVASRIIAVTRGNPLALQELSGELTAEHLIEHAPLPDPLPIGELIEARFLRQVRLLPNETQLLLLAAAADPEGDRDTLWRASGVLGLSAAAIEPAADSGLLVLHPRIEFRHPLVRSAVYSGATAADRRLVHHALAEVMNAETDPDRKALHMASGALGPDESVAAALEQSAAQARARGGYVAESSFLVRSANLTPDPHRQAGRLLLAAQAAFLAGNAGYSESLLSQARPLLSGTFEKAQAQRLDGHLRYPLGQPHLAPSLLLGAAKEFGSAHPILSHHSLIDAMQACGVSLELTEGTTGFEIGHTALEALAAEGGPATPADVLLNAFALRYCEGYTAAVPAMREAVHAQADMSFEEINRWNYLAGILAIELWDEAENRSTMARLESAARATGALPALEVALAGLATIDRRAGRFNEARERYAELHDVALAIGDFVEFLDLFDVELLCWQGDERARSKAAQLMEGGAAFCYATLIYSANLSLSTLELAEGRYDAALAAGLLVTRGDGLGWSSEALPIVVEAAVRCGDTASATEALNCLAERATAAGTPWALGLLARCRALLTNGAAAAGLYEEGLNHLSQTSLRTEVARTHLVYGEWLRRQRHRTEAREQLRRAYEMFDTMGAKVFAERARIELLATGERVRARRVETAHDLTSREMQVARLAAQRATSREIAGQLFISANTVDYHLRKVFQKLGVTSRRDLSGVLFENENRSA
jgi:DNA-binding CsgD family transcriptional regulator